jgi:regulator of RNase E activity RraA
MITINPRPNNLSDDLLRRYQNIEPARVGHLLQMGGVSVNPGDLVTADSDGIVILAPAAAAQIVDDAKAKESRSAWIREELLSGTRISELSGAAEKIRARL